MAGPVAVTGPRDHGGPDAQGVPRWDFSSNANACGPAPSAWQAVQAADRTRYPDPSYQALRDALGAFHGVPPQRVLIGASASELIFRLTAAVARRWPAARVFLPRAGYGDYAAAAHAHALEPAALEATRLVWHAEPDSPRGQAHPAPSADHASVRVVDRVYAPLRLEGDAPAVPVSAWQLASPNKALGLTGVRGGYLLAPEAADDGLLALLQALAPSWPLGADGVALLLAWTQPVTQQWLADSLATLRGWKRQQLDLCRAFGWQCEPGVAPFFVARSVGSPPLPTFLPRLREAGVKLRDAASLGLPGAVRLSVQPPAAQDALAQAWHDARKGSRQ